MAVAIYLSRCKLKGNVREIHSSPCEPSSYAPPSIFKYFQGLDFATLKFKDFQGSRGYHVTLYTKCVKDSFLLKFRTQLHGPTEFHGQ